MDRPVIEELADRLSRRRSSLLEDVAESQDEMKARHLPALRPVGEGIYRMVRHGDHTHFVYALELPKATGGAQGAFNLENEASYIISIKNPKKGSVSRHLKSNPRRYRRVIYKSNPQRRVGSWDQRPNGNTS